VRVVAALRLVEGAGGDKKEPRSSEDAVALLGNLLLLPMNHWVQTACLEAGSEGNMCGTRILAGDSAI